jgi:hypothetical protein
LERARVKKRVERSMAADLRLSPEPLPLGGARRLTAVFSVWNRRGAPLNIEFLGEQRFDVEIADERGTVVTRWSEDRPFSREPGFAAVNPGEELVYTANLPTRDLKAGQKYSVEAFLIGYEGVRIKKVIVPVE